MAWNTAPETDGYGVGSSLTGKLDFDDIGAIGHSRGASAAIELPRQAADRAQPYLIKSVLVMSPGPLTELDESCTIDGDKYADLTGVNFGGLTGTCDGDVGSSHA